MQTETTYDPGEDLATRHPGWGVHVAPIGLMWFVCHTARMILLDASVPRDWALARVVAHLDLGHRGAVTVRQEAMALLLAGQRLGLS